MKYTYVYLSAQLLTTPCVYNFSSDSDYFCHVYLRLMIGNSNSQMTAKENVSSCLDFIMHNFLHCELTCICVKNLDIMKRRGRFDFQILVWNETLEPTTSS